jgi:hypothetical protein
LAPRRSAARVRFGGRSKPVKDRYREDRDGKNKIASVSNVERVTANEVADERVIGFLLEQSARFDMCVGLCSVANPEHPSAF